MADADSLKPLSLRREGDGLLIEWSDGLRAFIAWKELRKLCPCATCIDEREKPADPFRVLSPRELESGAPEPVKMAACGYYAYKITWNDGHDTGIYTLEYLRSICKPAGSAGAKE
jgi:DUF971 family protein